MKKAISKQIDIENDDDMLPEYDFKNMKGGVRGKYYKTYRAGHTAKIDKAGGTAELHYFKLEDGAMMLESDVREYFPDSETVNNALRCLIPIMTKQNDAKQKKNLTARRKQMA